MIKLIVIIALIICIAIAALAYSCIIMAGKVSRLEEKGMYDNFNT